MRRFPLLLAAFSLLSLSACPNIFAPIDNPSGDAQILSAARACFDKGDYECAAEYYTKLGHIDAAIAENALLTLERNGLGIGPIARAISSADGSLGSILTNLTEAAAPAVRTAAAAGDRKTVRNNIVAAYKKIADLDSRELKGFVRFMTSLTLAGVILAEHEDVYADGIFSKADVVDPACDGNLLDCSNCGNPINPIVDAIGSDDDATNFIDHPTGSGKDVMTGNPSWSKFYVAIQAASAGLSEMVVETGQSAELLSAIIKGVNDNNFAPKEDINCFRSIMVGTGGFGR